MSKEVKKIFVAMSGGVDSSVAALLLKQKGYDVSGVYFELFGKPASDWQTVKKVAKQIGIKVKKINFRKEFKKEIIDYFCQSYISGQTPNPCVFCNHQIKMGLFWKWAKKRKANNIATGHYARLRREFSISNIAGRQAGPRSPNEKRRKIYKLLRGKDLKKDQSYFLYRLGQEDLEHILFPLGELTKKEVIRIAQKNKLINAGKSSSQDVCFLQGLNLMEFLRGNIKEKIRLGDIKELETGKIKGRHKGLLFYTVGQREGIGLSGGPWYVFGKDEKNSVLYITKDKDKLFGRKLTFTKASWIYKEPKTPIKTQAQIRYQGQLSLVDVKKNKDGKFTVFFKNPQYAVTAGQSVVFYNRDQVLGGGIISK